VTVRVCRTNTPSRSTNWFNDMALTYKQSVDLSFSLSLSLSLCLSVCLSVSVCCCCWCWHVLQLVIVFTIDNTLYRFVFDERVTIYFVCSEWWVTDRHSGGGEGCRGAIDPEGEEGGRGISSDKHDANWAASCTHVWYLCDIFYRSESDTS